MVASSKANQLASGVGMRVSMDDEARGLYPRARERNMLMPAGAIEKDFQCLGVAVRHKRL